MLTSSQQVTALRCHWLSGPNYKGVYDGHLLHMPVNQIFSITFSGVGMSLDTGASGGDMGGEGVGVGETLF